MRFTMVRPILGSSVVFQRCVPLFFASILFSCAGTALPRDIKVMIPGNYAGDFHVVLCHTPSGMVDQGGGVSVADCPQTSERLQLVVTQGGKVYTIPPEKLTIKRTGDGIPVLIEVHLP
jgi:hypothetical protein